MPVVELAENTEKEAYDIAKVQYLSFQTNDLGRISRGTADPDEIVAYNARTRMASTLKKMYEPVETKPKNMRESSKEDLLSGTVVLTCRDEESGELLGVAIWILPPLDADAQKCEFTRRDLSQKPADLPHGMNWDAIVEIKSRVDDHIEQESSAFVSYRLGVLATLPSAQRRGVGKALLQWGLERAAQDKLPVLLEATEPGYPLYKRMGFKDGELFQVYPKVFLRSMRWDVE